MSITDNVQKMLSEHTVQQDEIFQEALLLQEKLRLMGVVKRKTYDLPASDGIGLPPPVESATALFTPPAPSNHRSIMTI